MWLARTVIIGDMRFVDGNPATRKQLGLPPGSREPVPIGMMRALVARLEARALRKLEEDMHTGLDDDRIRELFAAGKTQREIAAEVRRCTTG